MNLGSRRLVLGGAAALGALMILSSSAAACTIFRGKMTVTGGGGSTSATGSNASMSWCSAGLPTDNAAAPGGGAHGADGSSITVRIEPGASPCNTVSPDSSTTLNKYDINFYNGKAFTYTISATTGKRVYSTWLQDCMSGILGIGGHLASDLTYTKGTTKEWTVSLPAATTADAAGQASAVCFSDRNANNGNQVPIIITA